MDNVESIMEKLAEQARRSNVEVIFGATREFEDRAIIPVGKVMYGFGSGGGKAPESQGEGAPAGPAMGGEGQGAGMGAKVQPMGYILITRQGVSYKPILDMTMVTMAAAVVAGLFILSLKKVAKAAL